MLARLALDLADLVGHAGADGVDEAGLGRLGLEDLFLLGRFGLKLFDHADDLDHRLVPELDGVGDVVLTDLAPAQLDHVDEVLGAGDDQIEVGVFQLLDGRVEDEFSFDTSDADVRDGRDEGDVGNGDGR